MKRLDAHTSFRCGVSRLAWAAVVATALGGAALPCAAAEMDWSNIAGPLGKSGAEMPGGVYRVSLPRLFFMHFWANDDSRKLAQGLRAALDKINILRN